MRTLFIGVLSLGLVVGTGALADDHHHDNDNNNHNGNHESHSSEHHDSGDHHDGGGDHHVGGGDHHVGGGDHRDVTVHRDVDVHRDVHRDVTVHRDDRVVHRGPGVRGHENFRHFHAVFRAPHRFHMRAWVGPRGFAYRRFGIGERIPGILLAADFFIADYALYGLEYPGEEYVWVRDGDDAVLVDRYTGEVIEVEYDVFY